MIADALRAILAPGGFTPSSVPVPAGIGRADMPPANAGGYVGSGAQPIPVFDQPPMQHPVPHPQRHVPDQLNQAAVAYATARINQLVRAHLLGGVPQNMQDPTQVWRGLSATLAQNPAALQAFLHAAVVNNLTGPHQGRH